MVWKICGLWPETCLSVFGVGGEMGRRGKRKFVGGRYLFVSGTALRIKGGFLTTPIPL